jgi:hypothetical protein
MKWESSVTSECSYSDCAELIWKDADIVWESSSADYQGHAEFIARMPNGRFSYYYWDYGTCEGCDTWAAAGLSHDEVAAEMRVDALWFKNEKELRKFLKFKNKKEYESKFKILLDRARLRRKFESIKVDSQIEYVIDEFKNLIDNVI